MTASAPSLSPPIPYARACASHARAYRSEILSAAELRALDTRAWDHLASRGLEDNPFLSARFVLAALDAYPALADCGALAVYAPTDGALVGLFPFAPHRLAPLLPAIAARSGLHLYQVQGTPLLERAHAPAVVDQFLGALLEGGQVNPRWMFPHVPLEGPFARLLGERAGAVGFETRSTRAYARSVLTRDPQGFDAHVDQVIGKKRKKDIARNLRRLGELGALRFERVADPAGVAQRVEDFLALEASGWKGAAGTALLSNSADAKFARAAFGQGEGAMIASVDALVLDDRPIALSLNISAGGTVFTPKCAYDETYRKYGPGLALEYKVIEAFYRDPALLAMDSATTVEGHVISSLWNDSVAMGTLVLGPKGTMTGLVAGLEDTEFQARRLAKRLLGRE